MRYAILGDIHANLEALKAVLLDCKKEAVDRYFCLGDIVGYGPNPCECIRKIKEFSAVSVCGNHDWAAVDLFSLEYFNDEAKEALFWTKKYITEEESFLLGLPLVYQDNALTLVHATLNSAIDFNYLENLEDAQQTFALLKTQVCFVGHTHCPKIFFKDDKAKVFCRQENSIAIKEGWQYIINVGSVGQPRDGDWRASYCLYDSANREVRVKRIGYDVETTSKKILQAGLPSSLATRLLIGR